MFFSTATVFAQLKIWGDKKIIFWGTSDEQSNLQCFQKDVKPFIRMKSLYSYTKQNIMKTYP